MLIHPSDEVVSLLNPMTLVVDADARSLRPSLIFCLMFVRLANDNCFSPAKRERLPLTVSSISSLPAVLVSAFLCEDRPSCCEGAESDVDSVARVISSL